MNKLQLVISSEYEKLVPNVSDTDFQILKKSIKENGLWTPVYVNAEGVILDGYHRQKACKELGIKIKFAVREFENKLLEKKFVIECNLVRRQLNDFQKSELGIPLQKINEEITKEKESQRKKGLSSNDESHNSNKETSKQIGVSQGTFERAKKIINEAPEETKEKLRIGKTTISKEYQKLNKQQKKEQRQQEIQQVQVNLPETVTLHNQEFQSAPIPDNSISLIFTDPPYTEECLYLYDDLAAQAARVLRDGGSLICYAGHYAIGKIINMMEKHGLKYNWQIVVNHSGPAASQHGPKVFVTYKPMLWFVKGKREGEYVRDGIQSEFQGKELHEWAQSTIESDYYIKHLTIENEIVYDPFLGQGTFGVSAAKLKRQFIGCEVDPEHFANARRMISNANQL